MAKALPDTEVGWYEPLEWPVSLAACRGCGELLLLLLDGWRVPSEEREWTTAPPRPARQARDRRLRFLELRVREGRNIPWTRGRPLLLSDGPARWRQAGQRDYLVGDVFTDERLEEEDDRRGRDRLHRHITPAVVAGVVEKVDGALEHLYQLPGDALEGHFTDVYGRPWPPGLEPLHGTLVDRWERGYPQRGTAVRVAAMLPLRTYDWAAGSPVRVPLPLTWKQVRRLWYQREKE